MTKPTIYITNLTTSEKYKVVGVNKETQNIDLLSLGSGIQSTEAMADFSGSNFKVEKVTEPEPEVMTEQEESYTPPKSLADQPYPFGTDQRESNSNSAPVDGSSKTELTESHSGAPTQQDVAETTTTVAFSDIPEVTNRASALSASNQFKEELRPIFERAKLMEQAVAKGHKGEAKKISYVIQWLEKYLAD